MTSRLLTLMAVAVLTLVGTEGSAAANATTTIDGTSLFYGGHAGDEHVRISRDVVTDDDGATSGYYYSVHDTIVGGAVTGSAPCGSDGFQDAVCPFGAAEIRATLAAGDDTFFTFDEQTSSPGCESPQALVPVVLDAGPGADLTQTGRLGDTVDLGPGADSVETLAGDDRVTGGSGGDLIETFRGSDVVDGDAGNDVIHLDDLFGKVNNGCKEAREPAGDDVARGGAGNDAITALGGSDRIDGGSGNDYLNGGEGVDTVLGGSGRDTIWSRDGKRDTVNCGPGRDVVEGSDRTDRVRGCEKRTVKPVFTPGPLPD